MTNLDKDYIDPSILRGRGSPSSKSDIYSAGVLLARLLTCGMRK
jgi:serine/threonine protein kinase